MFSITFNESLTSTHAAAAGGVAIRVLAARDEFAACVDLQRAVWGWSDLDIMPVRLFVLVREAGGLVLGAYHGDALIGFTNCVPASRNGRLFWHSHMLAVLPAYRDRGIGTALKLAQREHAGRNGIASIQWVFDPLEAKNAYLNVAKLGAVIRRYSVDHYGASTSRLHAGLASDRAIAEWQVDAAATAGGVGRCRRVAVPADVQAMRRSDLDAVQALQRRVRDQFLGNLADGFVVVGCERHAAGIDYVFRRERPARAGKDPACR